MSVVFLIKFGSRWFYIVVIVKSSTHIVTHKHPHNKHQGNHIKMWEQRHLKNLFDQIHISTLANSSQRVNLFGLCTNKEGKAFFPMSSRRGETNNKKMWEQRHPKNLFDQIHILTLANSSQSVAKIKTFS
jgi:hypothetical protein